MERAIRIINTVGKSNLSIVTAATTNYELQQDLSQYGITQEGLLGIIGETQVKLDTPDKALPMQAFTLFLFPGKVDSGNGNAYGNYEIQQDLSQFSISENGQLKIGGQTLVGLIVKSAHF